MLKTQPEGRRRAGAAGWCLVVVLTIFNACTAAWFILGSGGMGDAFHITTRYSQGFVQQQVLNLIEKHSAATDH